MDIRKDILAHVQDFRTRRSLSERRFGLLAVGDTKFVHRVREGAVTIKRCEEAFAYISEELAADAARDAARLAKVGKAGQ